MGKNVLGEKPEDSSAEQEGFRIWRTTDGRKQIRGRFVDLLDGKVCLELPDGTGTVLPLEELASEDREFVRQGLANSQGLGLVGESGQRSPPSSQAGIEEIIFEDELVTEGSDLSSPTGQAVARVDTQSGGEHAGAGLSGGGSGKAEGVESTDQRKVVIPFDFVSRFDNGRYGQMVSDMIWKKLQREGGFIIPDSMLEVRDFCESQQIQIDPETPLAEVARIVRGQFGAHIAIWGSVERAPGAMWDIYDLVIKCADFSGAEPKVLFDLAARTNTVSEIPHLYTERLLDKLYDRQPGAPRPPDPVAEENWKNNPNLLSGGDFQRGQAGVPLGWESRAGQEREPLGRLVRWVTDPDNPENKMIRFQFGADVGDTAGVMYYSELFPIEEGATYRFQCRWRTSGPAVKVFIKCYDSMRSEYRPTSARAGGAGGAGSQYVPEESQLRECYRSQQNLKGPASVWNVHTEDFTPRHTKYDPQWGRVMLYAYLGAGVVEFDDVVVKQILPASPGETQKQRRHSMASPVTLEEMKENERRGQEARERLRNPVGRE